ncbi:ferrous iron transport protein B [Salana multivorans]|uniref:Ferrous iron transport protein B n=1 Tax=Salana multivorans TaxID=120377 RepID=A0A3N2D9X3_9MICO|nr:ferrous iron transporter B [Salana multivorans]ROR96428.1 ferrous iron transport protein B [Salana multivorans]
MSCHEGPGPLTAPDPTDPAAPTAPRVVLLGNPNVGKSTLFNTLVGAHQRVMNAPGTTVELHEGTWHTPAGQLRIVDLPGTYSLLARSADEQVAADAALANDRDVVVVTLEAAALPRALYLLGQLLAQRPDGPVVVALTMVDVARDRGITPDPARLERALGLPVVAVDPRRRAGTRDLETRLTAPATVAGGTAALPPARPASPDADDVFAWVTGVLAELDLPEDATATTISDRVDRVLLNPWIGLPVFGAVMWLVFQLATTIAGPVMDATESVFAALGTWILGWLPGPAWVGSFLVDGVLVGFGVVASFVPLLALVFGAIALLEDSGYLARAAFVADRAMQAIGLDGRAMLPLVIGFGCNVPALTATKTLPHARSRLLVGLLIPLTSCPARLTVLLLIASSVFPEHTATAVLGMYAGSIVLVVGAGLVLRRTLFRDLPREGLVLALPAYQRPRPLMLLRAIGTRSLSFVRKAGIVIVTTLAVVWVLLAIPVTPGHTLADVPIEDSAYGAAAHAIAPALEPAGFGDWHFSAALATGFVAKEVVVGSFAQTYSLTEPDDPTQAGDLGAQLRTTLDRTSGGHAGAAALAFLVFMVTYTPCLATLAEQRRLFGWRWTLGAAGAQIATAWLLAVLVFQVGRLL